MTPGIRRRLQAIRRQAMIRAWDYRQRDLARGAWFALRRVLADAREAYAVSDETARSLLARGHQSEAAGLRVSPPKTLIFVAPEELAMLPDKQPVAIGLTAELLAASNLVLLRF